MALKCAYWSLFGAPALSTNHQSPEESGFVEDDCEDEVLDHLLERIEEVEARQKRLRRGEDDGKLALGSMVSCHGELTKTTRQP
ncbi:hypothetical protein E2562_014971 [Oryza meyeriana var. granulata]|uniref:Uncharacterized protein n=1 Tax=Oryza meyeriana var. granulata TaxID=110450 RepID=A0A6G1EJB0_9ORYZ|nr:hypothetical protein E2562_014971 [Oryza meyeriana var. granulata]